MTPHGPDDATFRGASNAKLEVGAGAWLVLYMLIDQSPWMALFA